MHAIEKILAHNANLDHVHAGEIVVADVDFCEINDLYLQTVYSFYEMGGEYVFDNEKVAFVFDHYAPAPDIKSASNQEEMRSFRDKNKLKYHFDTNCGICHQVMPEKGVIRPGNIVVATDSHTTTHGAFGAFGTGVGATDMATILMTGKLWFRVPEIININLKGLPKEGVYAKDVVLYILGKIGADGAVYKAIDFTGEYIDSLLVSERMTICNMAVEMGAKTAYMQPNDAVLDYVKSRTDAEFTVYNTDDNFIYDEVYEFDLSEIDVQVATPGSVDNVVKIDDALANGEVKVNQCYIGSCTNGRVDDLKIAADILRGKHIADNVRLVVIPASSQVMIEAMNEGYITDLMMAGATISTPGCGACLGAHQGILSNGEVCISTTNRNFPGRMGSNEAQIYLASPATVAASALYGVITKYEENINA